MHPFISPYVKAVVGLVYPVLCESCLQGIPVSGGPFCISCLCQLPYTGHEQQPANAFREHFTGSLQPVQGAALFHLRKGSQVSKMLHRLKYHDRPDTALKVGRFFGQLLNEHSHWQDLDGIIPVPLHRRKERRRGYNQSERFARGMSVIMGIPVWDKVLMRHRFTKSQTRMNRMQRLDNMENAFKLKPGCSLSGMHVLLVDDVLTTGATLEACARQLNDIDGIRISMATMAMGRP